TNKVYGALERFAARETATRWEFRNLPNGVSEDCPLDFHSPYGCSRGAGDQYVRDYARIYGLPTVVFRQSCIYGPRQFGVEDQGWVAWFAIAALFGLPLMIYGDGKTVRDLLFIDDLVDAFERARRRIDKVRGQIFNIGGGPRRRASLREVIALLERLAGRTIKPAFQPARPGDQPVYYSDIRKAKRLLGWEPRVDVDEGVGRLVEWLRERHADVRAVLSERKAASGGSR
ncbi:MAG: GDP-mannose 4,6-dehydratase, partial [Candidatus Sumerlaeota bacterium]|nr:GDP-mannose 4,6-dehydratase [Candidatus Sumerlaeota bacterium]